MRRFTLGVWLLSCLAFGQTRPVSRTIAIGDTELSMGMSKSRVLTALSKQFAVANTGKFINGAEYWIIKLKDDPKGIGNVCFKNDVLVSATKQWDDLVLRGLEEKIQSSRMDKKLVETLGR